MGVQFGIFDHLDRRDEPLAQTYGERLEFVRAAEQAGFRAYHLAEHHGTPLGMAPSPALFLAAAARETTRIRLGAMVYLLPLYIPLRLIEEICMLDHLSEGRLDVGTGRGVSPAEVGFYGIDQAESGPRYGEALEVITKGLTEERLTHHGSYFRYDDVPMVMKPLQDPLPLWNAAMAPEGQRYAVRHRMHMIGLGATAEIKRAVASYREIWAEHAGDAARPKIGTASPFMGAYRILVVGKTDAHAEALARPAFRNWFEKLIKLWREHNITPRFLGSLGTYEAAAAAGMLIVGSPARVIDALAAQIELCGLNYLMLQLAFGNLPHREELRSLERFATEVMPAF